MNGNNLGNELLYRGGVSSADAVLYAPPTLPKETYGLHKET